MIPVPQLRSVQQGRPLPEGMRKPIKVISVNSRKSDLGGKFLSRRLWRIVAILLTLAWTSLTILTLHPIALAQSSSVVASKAGFAESPPNSKADGQQSPNQAASITGTVVDGSGAVIAGARVLLTRDDHVSSQEILSDQDGQFSFTNLTPGPYSITVTSEGLEPQTSSGILRSGEIHVSPPIMMAVATAKTEVEVTLSPVEVGEQEIKDEEKQRVFGVIPNFFVTYAPNPPPLTARQKLSLAWKTTTDPVTFGVIGLIAGIQQSQNAFAGYGQGAQGYGKRYGAAYADLVSGTFIGGAVLPVVLKQDPRYFYKGTGSRRSRILYAIASSVICRGDNGRWQPNYSNILGSLAAGGISNFYYPASDRNGAALTFETASIGIGITGAVNILQEFVVPRLTPRVNRRKAGQPAGTN